MVDSQPRPPSPDDTAAFQRFYSAGPTPGRAERGLLYRLLIGWWRDRR
ncbi:MAG: hypothetical protein JO337_13690 [Acidimicrobiales bacterium]|nr:hypothetical protein [Acidimicrobiales bacterium]